MAEYMAPYGLAPGLQAQVFATPTCSSWSPSTGWPPPRRCSCCATWSWAAPAASTRAATWAGGRGLRRPRGRPGRALPDEHQGAAHRGRGGRAVGVETDDGVIRPARSSNAGIQPRCSASPAPSTSRRLRRGGCGARAELVDRRYPLRVRHPGLRRRLTPVLPRTRAGSTRPASTRCAPASGPTSPSSRSTWRPSSTRPSSPSPATRSPTSRCSCRPTRATAGRRGHCRAVRRAQAVLDELYPDLRAHHPHRAHGPRQISRMTRDAAVPGAGGEAVGLARVVGQVGRSSPTPARPCRACTSSAATPAAAARAPTIGRRLRLQRRRLVAADLLIHSSSKTRGGTARFCWRNERWWALGRRQGSVGGGRRWRRRGRRCAGRGVDDPRRRAWRRAWPRGPPAWAASTRLGVVVEAGAGAAGPAGMALMVTPGNANVAVWWSKGLWPMTVEPKPKALRRVTCTLGPVRRRSAWNMRPARGGCRRARPWCRPARRGCRRGTRRAARRRPPRCEEVGALDRGITVDRPGPHGRVVGHDGDGPTAEAGQRADERAAVGGLDVQPAAAVDQAVEHVAHPVHGRRSLAGNDRAGRRGGGARCWRPGTGYGGAEPPAWDGRQDR